LPDSQSENVRKGKVLSEREYMKLSKAEQEAYLAGP